MVELRQGEDVFSIPARTLYSRGGRAFSHETLEQLKHSGAAH
jgi:hypothetical protein